jgi:hypothetical protein
MIQKIKKYLVMAATMAVLATPTIGAPVLVSAVATVGDGCKGISQPLSLGANTAITNNGTAGGEVNCNATGTDDSAIKTLAAKITNTFSIIVGAASVIMIIYGGFRYVTSGGESGRVGAAKNALLYAIVGLVIVALAQLIVHFVLAQSAEVTNAS